MKSTGTVRRIDDLGRITIPRDVRRHFGWGKGQPVEILSHEGGLTLRAYQPGCQVPGCWETETREVQGLRVCRHHAGEFLRAWEAK
jgi:transcriptional pleiotropic regulator of transition state genes